ncbi:hypothetical protein GF319_14765 [Candidatus Bathyarchaeota archaeon]|nr:hypothetical protein [Candidatus Bathyarchaeota archaeon]
MSSSRRKMLAAQEDIANEIVDLAKRKDMTVYQTVNDILEQVIRVDKMGFTLEEVVEERWMLERAREIGFTFTIEHLLYLTVDAAFKENSEKFLKIWRDMGHWYGKYFDAKHEEPMEAFKAALELLTIGSADYYLDVKSRIVSISFLGERLTSGYIELFSEFLEALMNVFEYDLHMKESRKGILKMEFRR